MGYRRRHEDAEEVKLTYCAVDGTLCNGICAELYKSDCSELVPAPRSGKKSKRRKKGKWPRKPKPRQLKKEE